MAETVLPSEHLGSGLALAELGTAPYQGHEITPLRRGIPLHSSRNLFTTSRSRSASKGLNM